jgi:uncharacterized protein (DUF305 family)
VVGPAADSRELAPGLPQVLQRVAQWLEARAGLAYLAKTEGRAFDRLFLEYMIHHHRGALTMVSRLNAANGGAEPEIGAFVRHVEADQHIEIGRMDELLVALDDEPARSAPRRAKRAVPSAGGKPLICFIR